MTRRHHPRGPVQHRTEVVGPGRLRLAGRDPHPYRQLQRSLRLHGGIDRRTRRCEGCAHTVARVVEQVATVLFDNSAEKLVMNRQRCPHRLRVGLPPPRGTLDVGEEESQDARGPALRFVNEHNAPPIPGDLIVGSNWGNRTKTRGLDTCQV